MENHATHQNTDPNSVANDLPENIQALIPVEILDDISRIRALKHSKNIDDLPSEEKLVDDWTWLWDFEHEGVRLTEKEINFIIDYTRSGFKSPTESLDRAKIYTNRWIRPVVNAALHQATKKAVKNWECSLAKVHRVLFNILESKPTDVMEVSPTGIILKDFSQIDPAKLDAVQEIHEIRNHQGTQIRIKFYDKIAAATNLTRMHGGFTTEKLDVNVNFKGFEDRLASALQRIAQDDIIDGEIITDE